MKHSPTCPAVTKEALRGPDGRVRETVKDWGGHGPVIGKIETRCGCSSSRTARLVRRLMDREWDGRHETDR